MPGKLKPGTAVHREGVRTRAMDRSRIGEPIRDYKGYRVALAPAQDRSGNLAVDRSRGRWPTRDVQGHRTDLQVETRSRLELPRCCCECAAQWRRSRPEHADSGDSLNEAAAA